MLDTGDTGRPAGLKVMIIQYCNYVVVAKLCAHFCKALI